MVEIHEAKKCCFCLPLRLGLLALVYFKLAIVITVFAFVEILFVILLNFIGTHYILAFIIFGKVLLVLEIIFDILFIISAHKKKYLYLRIYYRYQLVMLVKDLILFIVYIVYVAIEFGQESHILGNFVGIGFAILILIALHVYFVYLVRSEVRKLQLATQFQFSNFPNEPECSAQILE